jgi:hypothetical protein
MARISTKNMQAATINQKRGPTTGNESTGTKRADFMSEKARSGSEKSELANMITGAVAARGRGMEGFRDKTVEGLHTMTNVGRGPTKGNAGKQQKSAAARKGALGASSGY